MTQGETLLKFFVKNDSNGADTLFLTLLIRLNTIVFLSSYCVHLVGPLMPFNIASGLAIYMTSIMFSLLYIQGSA